MRTSIAEMDALKIRLKATWMAGDIGEIAKSYERGATEFVGRLGLGPGIRVLDVACGTGNVAVPAARAGAVVTGIDIAPNVLEKARARTAQARLHVRFDEGDAEELPYDDGSFDVVVSMFGAMFAPHPELAAAELLRVCRAGGSIAMANWLPGGFIGQLFETTAMHVPQPAEIPSPLLWGDEVTVRSRLGARVVGLRFTRRALALEYVFGVAEVVEFWRRFYGPSNRAFAALDPVGQRAYRGDLERLWSKHNQSANGATHVDSGYLEVIAMRGD